ncbi:AAA family ATPase [Acinetobacter bereziniae]|uniref:AAA family ATPase n=1 Tax=Acinetobacter bereziniae TaxID=106648 RepID=UPI0012502753|nr:AAA family ATPase [Acinetobacter bereziniae]
MRKIYLPELINIRIKNFTLYPNGLDFYYEFTKGVNLVLGGNGMGKTTFVNIIKFSLIGHYKKYFDYSRTYKEKIIAKRVQHSENYFRNRMDPTVERQGSATVTIEFKIDNNIFIVERSLEDIKLISLYVNNEKIDGEIISELKYETLNLDAKTNYLQFKYEDLVKRYSGIDFDDLILFVNEILFFGEDHKTILWNNGDNGFRDIQKELFSRYFITPELDKERQEAIRQAKYYNSLSRHKSEDIRAIRKVLTRIEEKNKSHQEVIDPRINILKIKDNILEVSSKIEKIREKMLKDATQAALSQNKINELSLKANDLEREKNILEHNLKISKWENLNPYYERFLDNIKKNHTCPMCNKIDDEMYVKVLNHANQCFSCGKDLKEYKESDINSTYNNILEQCKNIHLEIKDYQLSLKRIDEEESEQKKILYKLEMEKRKFQKKVKELELEESHDEDESNVQIIYEEIKKLENEKEHLQRRSLEYQEQAAFIVKDMEMRIESNTHRLSDLFSSYAEKFLGVRCSLTFDKLYGKSERRLYPVIDGKIRFDEEELSESQRFFIDHSFRMSILSFFYQAPTFYIVETPDSSLDISYEENAAKVFLEFLQKPNSLIITSNLNNSSFVNHIIDQSNGVEVSLVGLLDIAKKSTIQNTSPVLIDLYETIKTKILGKKYA